MKFVLVLDLDECLAYSVIVKPNSMEMKHILQQYTRFPHSVLSLDDHTSCITIYRPYLIRFLTEMQRYFHFIVLYSLGEKAYVCHIAHHIQSLLVQPTYFDLILTHEDCLRSLKKYHVYKSIDYVKEALCRKFQLSPDELTVPVMIDDNPMHKVMNPETTFYQCLPFHPGQNLSSTWRYPSTVAHQWILSDQELQTLAQVISTTLHPLSETA